MKPKEKNKILWRILTTVTIIFAIIFLLHIADRPPEADDNFKRPYYMPQSADYNYSYPIYLLSENDYNSLVNYSFKFEMLNHNICNGATLLLVLIHSSPGNVDKRMTIRETWGNCSSDNIKIIFIIGLSDDNLQNKLQLESDTYNDIVQGNFEDTYRNLTYKHIMSLKYAIYHCTGARYVLKTDDDIFVNMPMMVKFLKGDLSPYGTTDLLFCSVKESASVLRSYRSKWRVAFEEYPFRTYPTYCPGWSILYSPDVLFKLYQSAQNTTNVFWIDDVHITGTLAQKNHIKHTDSSNMVISESAQKNILTLGEFPSKPFLFGRFDLKEDEIRLFWKAVIENVVPQSVFVDDTEYVS